MAISRGVESSNAVWALAKLLTQGSHGTRQGAATPVMRKPGTAPCLLRPMQQERNFAHSHGSMCFWLQGGQEVVHIYKFVWFCLFGISSAKCHALQNPPAASPPAGIGSARPLPGIGSACPARHWLHIWVRLHWLHI